MELDAFYGEYKLEVRAGDRVCAATLTLAPPPKAGQVGGQVGGEHHRSTQLVWVQCSWPAQIHFPVWISPVLVALGSVALLLRCFSRRLELGRAR